MTDEHHWTRRSFLAATGALLAAPHASGRDASRVRFGVRAPFATDDLAARIKLVESLGYDGIELGPEFLDRPVERIQSALAGSRVQVSAIVGSLKLLDPDPAVRRKAIELDRQRLRLAQTLGALGVIEVPAFGPCKFPEEAGKPSPHILEDGLLIEALRALAPDMASTGVAILIEPLTKRETHYMNLQSHGAKVIETADVRGPALLSDFYHMQMEEQDIGRTLATHGGHTAYVHLADGAERTEPGSLPFDYRPGFRALKQHGFHGWLTMECKATDDPPAALKRALAYIKRQWNDA
jgi:sugar phosphate isomerase/epimerase